MTLSERIKRKARKIGFDLVGIAAAGPAQSHTRYMGWLARGYHGAMAYLARPDAIARRADVRALLPSARSVVVVAMNYYTPPPAEKGQGSFRGRFSAPTLALPRFAGEGKPAPFRRERGEGPGMGALLPKPTLARRPGWGRVARYAWGDDYHEVMAEKMEQLVEFVEAETGAAIAHRICVDTSAMLEREWAMRAGLGWIGKNTLLINPRAGSWFLLGELVLDLELDYDVPFSAERCGACARCIEACPTHCILPDRQLDASRCISYLTIELRQEIPADLREWMGDWIFGCDVCQEVCPWNRFARPTREEAFAPRHAALDLRELAGMDDETFRARFAHSAIRRARREGLSRNAAMVAAHQAS